MLHVDLTALEQHCDCAEVESAPHPTPILNQVTMRYLFF